MLYNMIFKTLLASGLFCSPLVLFSSIEPGQTSSSYYREHLQSNLDKLIQRHAGLYHIGIEVASLPSRTTIYEKNGRKLFIPASCLKIFTSAACLTILGPHYKFSTTLWTDGVIKQKKLIGNLYLKGTGDPSLEIKDLNAIGAQLKALGVEKITGSVFVDHSAFDDISKGPGWMWDDEPEYWNVPISALTVNHGCIDLWVHPAEQMHQPATLLIHPNTSCVQCKNLSQTSAGTQSNLTIGCRLTKEGKCIDVGGYISQKSQPIMYAVAVDNPQIYAGSVFLESLKQYSISCRQGVEEKTVPAEARLLAEHESQPLHVLIQKMMKESDNLYAECFFKTLGKVCSGGKGTWSAASNGIKDFLLSKGLNTAQMVVVDGSGLSRYNLITPQQLVDILVLARNEGSLCGPFLDSFSISGIDGTLKKSMDHPELLSRVRAKTGSMKGVRTLCGYLTTLEGEELAFSIMMNGVIEKLGAIELENEICRLLMHYKKE